MKKIFGAKMDQNPGNRRELHNTCKERHNLVLPIKYYSGDQINKNEVGGACDMYRGYKRCMQGFGGEA